MKKIICLISLSIIVFACSSNDDGNTSNDSFNRTALLTNLADNIIIPSYVNYQTKVNAFQAANTSFTTTPNIANLATLKTAWYEAFKAYQTIALYEIGKAEELSIKSYSNIYPTDAVGIQANIAAGNFNLNLLSQNARQGYAAMDYLLYGIGNSENEVVAYYSSNENAKQYLNAVILRLKTDIDTIVSDWQNNYRNQFVANNNTTATGSLSKIANSFVKSFEKDTRAAKVGIPAGKFSNGVLFANKTEAFYKNDCAKELLTIATQTSKDFFNGKHFGSSTNGESLKSYLDFLNTERNGQPLSLIINNQFNTALTSIGQLNASLSQQVASDNNKMLTVFDDLQQNVVYLKLDMFQAINITVDYIDADGD